MSSVSQHDLVLPERWALNKAGRAIGRTLKWEDPPTMGGTIPWHSSGAEAQTFTGCSFPAASSCYCQFWTKDCSLELGALGSSLLQAPLAQDFIPAAEVERETGSIYLSFVSVNLSSKVLQTAGQDWPLLFVLLWQTQQGPPGEGVLLDTEPLTEMSAFWRDTFPPHASPGFTG